MNNVFIIDHSIKCNYHTINPSLWNLLHIIPDRLVTYKEEPGYTLTIL